MTENTDFLSISQTAAILGVKIADVAELLRLNVIESRTAVLRSSVDAYMGATA